MGGVGALGGADPKPRVSQQGEQLRGAAGLGPMPLCPGGIGMLPCPLAQCSRSAGQTTRPAGSSMVRLCAHMSPGTAKWGQVVTLPHLPVRWLYLSATHFLFRKMG